MDVKLLQDLLGAGPYGLAAIAFLVAGWAIRKWMEETRGRLDDQKEMGRQLESVKLVLQEQNRANEARNDAFTESVKLQALTGVAVTNNASTLAEIKTSIIGMGERLAATREALARRGVIDT